MIYRSQLGILQSTKIIFHLTEFSDQSKHASWCKIFSDFVYCRNKCTLNIYTYIYNVNLNLHNYYNNHTFLHNFALTNVRDFELNRLRLRYYFLSVKYFQEMKIFSSIWLHPENSIGKYFQVFGNILKMLFFYLFLTFPQLFSQLPNKFYNRKFQYINLKETKI